MKLKFGFFSILFVLTLILFPNPLTPAVLLAAFLHELGHVLAARLCHIPLQSCSVGLFGAGLSPQCGFYSSRQELLLCLSGPLVNLLSGSLSLLLPPSQPRLDFAAASLFLGFLNLLPVQSFDGGRILLLLLSLRLSPRTSYRLLRLLSFSCLFLLWTLSVYLLLRSASSLSLFVFSLSLFFKLFIEEKD